MEGIEVTNIFEKIRYLLSKYLIYILIALIVIVAIILIIPSKSTREKAISLAEKYIKSNNITLTNVEREISFSEIGMELDDDCYESGLVLASTNGYKVLYVCNNTLSDDLRSMLNANQLTLNGANPFYVKYGNIYEEPGYYVPSDDAIVKSSGMVINTIGMYLLKYEAIGNGTYLKSNRVVLVTNKSFVSQPTISLKGNTRLVIVKGEKWVDPGCEAYDSKDGVITRNVQVIGNVNTNAVGKYTLRYTVTNSSGKSTEISRYVTVVNNTSPADFEISYEPTTITNGDVKIKISVTGDGGDFILDPDSNTTNLREVREVIYKATSNGVYEFSLKKKDGGVIEKSIEITNIDKTKPTGSCKSVVTNSKTVVTVTANDISGIKKYVYTVGTYKGESTSNTYSVNQSIKTASVTVYDNASNYELISCIIDDQTTPIVDPGGTTPGTVTGTPGNYNQNVVDENGMKYIIYYPKDLNLSNKNPLVIFLHGSGECGSNINSLAGTPFGSGMKKGIFKGAVFLAPQCSNCSNNWDNCFPKLESLITKVVKTYNIDSRRISITGHSLGGIAVYSMIRRNPNLFASAVVVAGLKKESGVTNLLTTPIRHYHGTKDTSVSYSSGLSAANEIKNAGGKIEFIPLQGEGHAITDKVYYYTDAISWMISHYR